MRGEGEGARERCMGEELVPNKARETGARAHTAWWPREGVLSFTEEQWESWKGDKQEERDRFAFCIDPVG